jgi:hypothetical protein
MNNKFNDFGDDFFGRWKEFNKLMMESSLFRNEMERVFKMLTESKDLNDGISDIRIIPFGIFEKDFQDFDVPKDELDLEGGEDENGKWETKSWTSPDGSMSYKAFSRFSTPEDLNGEDLMSDLFQRYQGVRPKKYDAQQLKEFKIEKLQKALNSAVEKEDYEKAAELKKMIDRIKEEKFDNKK